MSLATIVLVGNVGKDPVVSQAGDTNLARFSVATSSRVKKDGEWVDAVSWWSVKVFGKKADFVGNHVKKGTSVVVTGEAQIQDWTDKDGKQRRDVVVTATEVRFAGGSKKDGGEARVERQASAPAAAPAAARVDDEPPF
jgi:single-strand DNA-binding protein